MRNINKIFCWGMAGLLMGLVGCTVHPAGESEERDAALRAGKPFEKQVEARQVPSLPQNPTPEQLVEYALLTNADLEQRYWEWRSAIEQIPQDATQTTSLNVTAGTTLTRGHASWGSSTVGLSNDPMTDIKWPGKLDAAAKQTLENARAAGHRFIKAKYELRSKVLNAYYDYALTAELIRLEESNQQLLQTTATITEARNRTGNASQQDVLKARNEVDISLNEIASMQSQLLSRRAAIQALLNQPADTPLPLPTELPQARSFSYSDSELLDLAMKNNPELIAIADEIRGRGEGIRLARLQYVPDLNLSGGTDLEGITQSVLGQLTIPLFRYEALNAAIAQAEANLRASDAMRRQTGHDLSAQLVADIASTRDIDRQLDLFEHAVLPRTRQVVNIGRSEYETGHGSLLDWLDSQRSLIGINRLVANLKITREKSMVDLEAITTTDLSRQDGAAVISN